VDDRRPCPACAEPLEAAAEVCPACGGRLPGGLASADAEHLRLLSIFHFVLGGLTAIIGCLPLLHVGMGLTLLFARPSGQGASPATAVGLVFVAVGGLFVLLAWTVAILMLVAGRCLSRRRRRTFCQIAAAAECTIVPLGTLLGAFTLIVLSRPSVRDAFDRP
jgi:hypothetical protein